MFPLVEFPELVKRYAPFFQDVFSPEAWIEFERPISGLIVSENKTVDGINRLLVVESRNQSSLNRLLTASPFSLAKLNRAGLELLAGQVSLQHKLAMADAMIYATAQANDATLWTQDEHFKDLPGVKFIEQKTK